MENKQPIIKKILFLGSRDAELVKSLQSILNGRQDVAVDVMDRVDLNRAEDSAKQKVIKWQEKEKMSNFIRNPFNVAAAIEKGEKLYESVKEMKAIEEFTRIMELNKNQELNNMSATQLEAIQTKSRETWDGWFVLKDVVGATTMNYKQAQEILDVLYAFGFLAFREVENVKHHTILLNSDMQIEYLNLLVKEKENDIAELKSALKSVEAKKKVETIAKQKQLLEEAKKAEETPTVEKEDKPLKAKRDRTLKKV